MGLIQEFKDFAMRGNVVDLAVGLIIGAEFGKVVNSAVNDLIMPPIGKALGGVNFADLRFSLGESGPNKALKEATAKFEELSAEGSGATEEAVSAAKMSVDSAQKGVDQFGEFLYVNYGQFAQGVINFLIIAFAVFMVVKLMNSMQKKEEAKPAAPPKQEVLLGEIRDLLQKQ
ncbi:MAG: large conductance mechanosensitive channel protein MscL [Planctomycetota bacterium]